MKVEHLMIKFLFIIASTNCTIKCPTNIRRFGAYPYRDLSKRSYYYECNKNQTATLKKCPRNVEYDAENENCDPYLFRMKRQVDQSQTSSNKLEAISKQPTLGRPVRLGALYYGSTDNVRIDEHLWSEITLQQRYKQDEEKSDFSVQVTNDMLDRANTLKIDASLALSFMGGLVQVSGSASYLSDRKKHTNAVSVSLAYEATTSTESLTMGIKNGTDYPSLCEKVGEENGPTHVISSITRGFKAVFDFQHIINQDSSNSDVEGSLSASIKSIPGLEVDGEVEIKVSETETISGNELDCTFHGDIILPQSPTNFQEAIGVYKILPVFAKTTTNIIYFDAAPITHFCSAKEAMLNKISQNNLEMTQAVMNNFIEIDIITLSLSKTKSALVYKSTVGKVLDDFRTKLGVFKNEWEQRLLTILPKVRSGSEAELQLMTLLLDYEGSPYEYRSATRFLRNRQRELETLELPINNKVDGITIEDDLRGNKCLFEKPDYSVRYLLHVLPTGDILQEYTESFENKSTSSQWSERQKWFWNDIEVSKAGKIYKDFANFRLWNKKRMDTCYMVSLQNAQHHANIAVYKSGVLLEDNFKIPTKINRPTKVYVSHDEILFDVHYIKDSVTTNLNVEYMKFSDSFQNASEPIKSLRIFPIADNGTTKITLNNLEANTHYSVLLYPGSDVGNGPISDQLLLQTNVFALPHNLQIEGNSDSSIEVSWEKPQLTTPLNLTVEKYKMSCCLKTGDLLNPVEEVLIKVVDPQQEKYTARCENLVDSSEYKIYVRSYNMLIDLPEYVALINVDIVAAAVTNIKTLQAPSVLNSSSHAIFLEWEPPSKITVVTDIQNYDIQFNRVDPNSGQALLSGTEKTITSLSPRVVLQGLIAGATYKVAVKVKTKSGGVSSYSHPTITATLRQQSDLETFRESLNLPEMETSINNLRNNLTTSLTNLRSQSTDSVDNLQTQIDTCSSSQANALSRITSMENSSGWFVAEITKGGGRFLPKGGIAFDTFQTDQPNTFEISGTEIVVKREGLYSLSFDAYVGKGEDAQVQLKINGNTKGVFSHDDKDWKFRSLTMMTTERLQIGDRIKILNYHGNTIFFHQNYQRITFYGNKIK